MISILRSRVDDCVFYEKGTGVSAWGDPKYGPTVDVENGDNNCKKIVDTFRRYKMTEGLSSG